MKVSGGGDRRGRLDRLLPLAIREEFAAGAFVVGFLAGGFALGFDSRMEDQGFIVSDRLQNGDVLDIGQALGIAE